MCNKKDNRDRTNFRISNKDKILDLTLNKDQYCHQKRSHKIFLKIHQKMVNSKSFQNIKIKFILINIYKQQQSANNHMIWIQNNK